MRSILLLAVGILSACSSAISAPGSSAGSGGQPGVFGGDSGADLPGSSGDGGRGSEAGTLPYEGDAGGDGAPSGADGAAASTGFPVIEVGAVTGATAEELTMIADGVVLANQTMATDCFKDFILAASWTENNGLSQQAIYDLLCSGPVTIEAEMYMGTAYENYVAHTVGKEYGPGKVYMNRFFVDSAYMVGDNLIHEAEGHSQGFTHYGVKATSVPYGLNDAFEACAPPP